MIITFNGAIGAGKSTIAKMLAEKLGWPYYSIGSLRRQKARERGMTLAEYNQLGEKDPLTDQEVDKYQARLGKEKNNFVIEGRTSWYFIPQSIKIYLEVEEKEGARRVFEELLASPARNEDKNLKTPADVLLSHQRRQESDAKRYRQYYGIEKGRQEKYDFVLDTTDLSREEVLEKIWEFLKPRLAKKNAKN